MSKNNKDGKPFLEKYMLPLDYYGIFKFGGSLLKDEELGIRTMLQYFSDSFTEEQLKREYGTV
jgi:hypothetical protein